MTGIHEKNSYSVTEDECTSQDEETGVHPQFQMELNHIFQNVDHVDQNVMINWKNVRSPDR